MAPFHLQTKKGKTGESHSPSVIRGRSRDANPECRLPEPLSEPPRPPISRASSRGPPKAGCSNYSGIMSTYLPRRSSPCRLPSGSDSSGITGRERGIFRRCGRAGGTALLVALRSSAVLLPASLLAVWWQSERALGRQTGGTRRQQPIAFNVGCPHTSSV